MKITVCKNYEEMSRLASEIMLEALKNKPNMVFGLPTGSTPVGTYKELAKAYAEGRADFSKAATFNLDEYYPIKKSDSQSYDTFMRTNLFNHINVPNDMIHIPNGEAEDADADCLAYDECIASFGGIDLQLLGIGRNGHIGFNEPDAAGLVAPTHKTSLTEDTIDANARFFESANDVPRFAVTMGMRSILSAKKIVMLASGKDKAEALSEMLNDRITTLCPATLLKLHGDVTIICDEDCYNAATK